MAGCKRCMVKKRKGKEEKKRKKRKRRGENGELYKASVFVSPCAVFFIFAVVIFLDLKSKLYLE